MGRRTYTVLSLGLLACGFLYLFRGSKPEPKQSSDASVEIEPTTARMTVLREALPTASQDAEINHHASEEYMLMQLLRSSLTSDPESAEALAREGQQRFPDSEYAEEREMLLVASLYNQRRIERARAEAFHYVRRHPNGRYVKDMSLLTGPLPATSDSQR